MSDFVVVDNVDDNITVSVSPQLITTVVQVQSVAFPVGTNIDGGAFDSLYGGTINIDGGIL